MVPSVAKTGRSFVGAGRYYLHDKRREGEDVRTSDERVAWTETRNMPVAAARDGPPPPAHARRRELR